MPVRRDSIWIDFAQVLPVQSSGAEEISRRVRSWIRVQQRSTPATLMG